MIYVLTEFDNASGYISLISNNKKDAMNRRKCTLTYNAGIKKYGRNYFYKYDIKCSQIDSYKSIKSFDNGTPKTTKVWY
jgi:hypothetical protein